MRILRQSRKNMDNFIKINSDFSDYMKAFLDENSKLNLISKNDEKVLFEKHIYDSLSIKLTNLIKKEQMLLDIGCGGGFPSVPIAIEYPDVYVTAVDSIRKKINAINNIKTKLNINNLNPICDRVENIKDLRFDIITSRAVAELSKISEYALPLLKPDGFFVAYKSKKIMTEIENAKGVLKQHNAEVKKIIEYRLPLEEIYERSLVVIGKK